MTLRDPFVPSCLRVSSGTRWPTRKIVAAYTLMALLAAASVWFIDRKVHLLPRTPANPSAANPSSR